jgi:uncharacterized protein
MSTSPPRRNARGARSAPPSVAPLDEAGIGRLQDLLDAVPAPLEPLDASSLDGFLCGVLVQPQVVPAARWLAHVADVDARPLPPRFDAAELQGLVMRRHAELGAAIAGRQWFDPWVFELEHDPGGAQAVYPWVAGFATALELFPALVERADAAALNEALALLYRHLAPDDLEDADELLAEIETLEPPADLTEAVEELVRATLLLADAAHPGGAPASARRRTR